MRLFSTRSEAVFGIPALILLAVAVFSIFAIPVTGVLWAMGVITWKWIVVAIIAPIPCFITAVLMAKMA